MKHGTGKQFEEQSRYTKGIWKRNRLRREQRDCPALKWLRISYRDVHVPLTNTGKLQNVTSITFSGDWNLPSGHPVLMYWGERGNMVMTHCDNLDFKEYAQLINSSEQLFSSLETPFFLNTLTDLSLVCTNM